MILKQAYEQVLEKAGASYKRDAVDQRVKCKTVRRLMMGRKQATRVSSTHRRMSADGLHRLRPQPIQMETAYQMNGKLRTIWTRIPPVRMTRI
ncbi:hypothetical protein FAZ15_18835 [Sphingobacterium olei]|uniref:Uncharacterized protein n=1 Tax=Sphingobacterium olei TaxID=2571155 RepID=A0A4U0NEG3_9SPHI|nr:hypothetical protein [Sphingobacterium olei]TJZ52455.1 hypothetical protein FAZ15_18835 [Sphingobacterium olei]